MVALRNKQPRKRPSAAVRELLVGDATVALRIRRHPRAKRISLRVDPASGAVVLTLPRRSSEREGLAFIEQQAGWIATRLAAQPPRQPFVDGAVIPYRGMDHRIDHRPEARGGVWRDAGLICVAGRAEHMSRRVTDWLRGEARSEITAQTREKAQILGVSTPRITIRDTTSRWGSCTADGRLNFSWRLILAPDYVLDYVVAHEVAHLEELNHGPRFHALIKTLTAEIQGAETWLRRHGPKLHRYG